MGEDVTDMATTTSQLQAKLLALTGGKVDIMLDANTFKNTTQILREMADAWEDMNDIQRASALELMGGKRQANTLSALIQNFETAEKVIEASAKSAGSALEENERYLDSIQGKLDQFNNALQSMWNNVLDDDLVKLIVQAGTELLKFIDNVGILKTLIIGIGTFLIQKNFKGDLFGGLFNAQSIDEAKDRLKNLKAEIATLQGEEPSKRNNRKITRKQKQADTLGASIKEYDELSEKLKQLRIDQDGAQKALDDYNKKLANKAAKGKKITDAEIAKQTNLNTKYNESKLAVEDTEKALLQAEIQAKATGMAGRNAGASIKTWFASAGKAVWKFAKEMAMSMAYTMAFTAIFEAIGNIGDALAPIFKNMDKSAEALQEKLSELQNELSSVESELNNLQSELKDTDTRIEELMSQGPLTFVEQEELNKLKSVSAELKAQIELQENLRKSMQQGVNSASIDATNAYLDTSFMSEKSKTEKQEEAKEIGSGIGQIAGTIIGGIVGTIIGGGIALASGGTAAVPGAAIGIAAGSAITGWIGGEAGSAIAGSSYDSEQSVEEAMDSMLETRAKLKEEQDKALAENDAEAYNEATEALRTYDAQMAKHISQIQQNYNAMDWATASPEDRQKMMEYADWLDKYNISMGTDGAKSNAIARIFGDEASEELQEVKKRMEEAAKTGEEISLADAFNGDEEAYNAFKTRLYDIGLTVYETEQYFKDEQKAAEDAIDAIETYDAIKNIQKLTSGVNELKNAFKELHDEGIVSAETLLGLEGVFGDYDGWKEFFEIMSSGTATIEQAEEAAKNLAENYVDEMLTSSQLSQEEYITTISHLQSLGITNAKQFLNEKIKKDAVNQIVNSSLSKEEQEELEALERGKQYLNETQNSRLDELTAKKNSTPDDIIKKLEEEYGIKLDGENDRLLVEKAITAEKLKQEAADKRAAKTAYDDAIFNKGIAEEKNEKVQADIDELDQKGLDGVLEKYGITKKEWASNYSGGYSYTYNGKTYGGGAGENELRNLILSELEGQKVEIPTLPLEVTDVDVTNADNAAETAVNDLQTELDKQGLTLEIDLVDKNELIDEAQGIFDTLASAAKEYGESGYVSVDTLQSLLQLEPKYLALLYNENGQLNLNKDSMYQLTVARVTDMGIQQAQQVIESARNALLDGNVEKLKALTEVTYGQADANWNLVTSNLALLKTEMANAKVDDSIYQGIESQVFAIQDLTNTTIANIGNTISSSGNTATAEVEDAFQNAMEYWENRIGANQSLYEQIQNDIDLLEKQGKIAGSSYYAAQIEVENERLQHLKAQREEARGYLNDFAIGSEKWWEISNVLNDIEGEIDDVTASIQDLSDAMDQVHWNIFDEAHERFGDLTTQLSNVRELLSADEDSLFNDEGEWTETGVAVLATHIQEIELYKSALADVNQELADLDISDFDSEQEYYDKLTELTNQQHDYTMAISDSKQSVVDMYESSIDAIEEYTQTLIDGYNDYIDSVKEALDAERDLYDFKKNVQKQAKDIANIERRIMSLSGSTNAADIAERRRLEADLYGAREELDDTYYSHAKESQQNALDAEAEAYEESMNKFVEGLRTSLEEATLNMDEFLMGVTSMVTLNAETVLNKYESTQLPLSTALTNPWETAKTASNAYSGDAIALMNEWTKDGGVFAKFSSNGTENLTSPWNAGKTAAQGFATSIQSTMSSVYTSISSNIQNSITELNKLKQKYAEINDTEIRASTGGGSGGGSNGGYVAPKQYYVTASVDVGNKSLTATRSGTTEALAKTAAKIALNGEYAKLKGTSISAETSWLRTYVPKIKYKTDYYAKGTLGTKRDEWAITDELGPELTMYATPEGTLSYMRAGSTVVPADLTREIIDMAELGVDGLANMPKFNSGVTMISNAINKPEINLSFEALVKAERIDENTLPEVKKFVQQEVNNLVKQMNYAIKGKGGR